METRCPKILATSVFVKKIAKANNHTNGRKFVKSGHPDEREMTD
jgi:hypothetical protein